MPKEALHSKPSSKYLTQCTSSNKFIFKISYFQLKRIPKIYFNTKPYIISII